MTADKVNPLAVVSNAESKASRRSDFEIAWSCSLIARRMKSGPALDWSKNDCSCDGSCCVQ